MLHYMEKEARKAEKLQSRATIENVSRRQFVGALAASGLVLAVKIPEAGAREPLQPYPTGGLGMPSGYGMASDPHVYVAINANGDVTIVTHRSEMGTGIRTSLPMVVADEMEADWSKVSLLQAPGDEPRYGNQDTDGSRSMRHFIQPMRECGAAMRQMLETAAAAKWGVDPSLCRAKNHQVMLLDKDKKETGQKLGFGELAEAAMALPVPPREQLLFKTPDEFTFMGKGEVKIADLRDITMGKAIYGADVRLPGMKFAVMARPAVVGGKVKSFDATAALAVPGIVEIHEIEGVKAPPYKFAQLGGIAVVANSTYAAIKAREALKIEWDNGPNAKYNSVAYSKEMAATAAKPGKVIRNQGDLDAAFANAKEVFTADYHSQHLVQASMEPLVAVARIVDGKAEVWAPIQSPYGARKDIAEALKLPIENVTVHVTLLGGGFGRKSKWDFMIEAALVSQKLGGTPVLLQWTREDDIQHSFYHTTSVERIEMAIDDKGKVTGWRHRTVAPSIISTFAPDTGYQFNIEYGMGFVNTPFDIPNVRCENGPGNGPHAHRLVSLGVERPARVRRAIGRVRGRRKARSRSEGFPARAHRPGSQARSQGSGLPRGLLELRRPLRGVPDRHRTAQERHPHRGREGRLGQDPAQGTGPRHCRSSRLADERRHRRSRGCRRGRHHPRPGGDHGRRLRLLRQSRAHPLADRGCRRDGHVERALQRHHLQEGRRRAVELHRLQRHEDEQLPEEGECAHCRCTARNSCRRHW